MILMLCICLKIIRTKLGQLAAIVCPELLRTLEVLQLRVKVEWCNFPIELFGRYTKSMPKGTKITRTMNATMYRDLLSIEVMVSPSLLTLAAEPSRARLAESLYLSGCNQSAAFLAIVIVDRPCTHKNKERTLDSTVCD